ncbi:hepatoma-derived growth factor-related protein 2-like isoform X1 [Anopheles merus]|uniref:hepatoma-derived growth factor-related protein 2-like isoform X1 n=1 Tax=Anopheles merus TaxID=30066 RepID=UPI001BE44E54|nr:hepatoma-derived growth factor-related protein 2-like isoform X1 [Anopheles merus]
MVASKKSFEIGDLVFAKVKGYPPWPAKVTRIEKNKYNVYFYGTGETANIKKEDLFAYETSKEKFATEKIMKRKGFKEAMLQIESALSGDDPSPVSLAFDVAAVQSGIDDMAESKEMSMSAAETTFDESHVSANSTVYNTSNVKQEVIDKQYGNENASTPQMAQIKSNANVKSTGAKKTAANAAAAHATNNGAQKKSDDATTVSPQQQDNSGGETKEVTSRRGRVIKQKRFMDGDDEDSGTGAGAPPKKKAMTLAPAKAKEAATPAATKKLNPFEKIADERLYLLKLERQLVELNLDIKSSVKLNCADPERCVKLMEQYENLSVTSTILKKNPNCVETMKRLRKYVGNAKAWNMDDKEKLQFDFQAQQIRNKAEQIYSRFKEILGMTDSRMPFWEWFRQEVTKFEEAAKNLTTEELFMLVDEKELIQDGQQQLTEPANATTELNETTNNDPSPAAEGCAEEGLEAPAPAEASAEKLED